MIETETFLAAKANLRFCAKQLLKIPDGAVHGKRSERETIMRAFAKEIDILVATSVIEVGVDQPNATMMIIENAERFGLAQLHQLRGRIGRGKLESDCFLFGEPSTDEGKIRLRLLTKLTDGFLIADEDLKLRGQGDLWGTRQSGEPLFRVAHPVRDEPFFASSRASPAMDPGASVKKFLFGSKNISNKCPKPIRLRPQCIISGKFKSKIDFLKELRPRTDRRKGDPLTL
jgi:RecG-like helicase